MPGRPHHTDKFRNCVAEVEAGGNADSAYAVCTASFQKKGEPIFVGAEAGSVKELRLLMDNNLSVFEHLHLLGATGKVRVETDNGREWLVVPTVALMEGVIHPVNARTPEFVPAAVLAKAAASWNGKPVTLGHPVKNGTQCSANDPAVLAAHGIGVIKNSRYDATTKKMLQEAWIDKVKAKALHPDMLARLEDGLTEEVSVGAFVVTDPTPGTYGERDYKVAWAAAQGDHLAFLPGKRGACSNDMGCGAHRAAMRILEDRMELVTRRAQMNDTPEEAASEEAAELVAYRSMRTLCDAIGSQWDQMSGVIDDLIADETENPTETPAQEEAEEEVETARVESIRTLCYAMVAALQNLANVTYSTALTDDPPTPGDPRYMAAMKDCAMCGGTGSLNGNPCEACDGVGQIKTAAGARHSTADMKMVQAIHDQSTALGAACDRGNYKMAEMRAAQAAEGRMCRQITQDERDKIPAEDFAGPHRSFFIVKPEDVSAAASSIGRAGGDTAAIKSKIISIAYRKGASFVAQLPEAWKRAAESKERFNPNHSYIERVRREAQKAAQ